MIEVLTGITVTEAGLNIYFATVVASLVAFSATVLAFQFSIPAARSLEPQTVDRAFAGSARFTWRMLFVIGAIASLTQSVLYIRYFLSGASYYDLYVTGTDTVGPPGLSFLASLLFYGYLGLLVVSANDTSRREHRLRLASTFVFVVVSLVGLTRGSRGEVFTELLVGLWMYSFTGGKSILVRHWLIYGVGLLGLSQVVGALRSGDAIFAGETQIVKIGEWFVYSQGVSGELVAPASTEFGVNPENVRFLLSPLLTPFRRVFDPSFGAQTAQTGQNSGLLAHELAFRVAPEAYLAGRGAGSSYLAECYCSLGIFGVILATAALTWIVLHGPHLFSRSRAALFIFAASLPYILFVPRESLMLPVIPVLKATVLLLICRRLGTLYVYYRRHSNV
jgi:oligosaccharide repeat unit polymerase